MRKVADEDRIPRFMRALGAETDVLARVYFTGGATAVLLGWRPTTIDVNIRVIPESDRLYRAIPTLKEQLEINVEPAASHRFCLRRAARGFPLFRIEAYVQPREGDDDAVLAELMKDGRMQLVREHQASILVEAEDP